MDLAHLVLDGMRMTLLKGLAGASGIRATSGKRAACGGARRLI